MKILECSTKGNRKFSAFYAKIVLFRRYDSIENFYQNAKGFNIYTDHPKGERPDFMILEGEVFPKEYLKPFYELMWIKYLDMHPDLVKHASGFDEFNDIFRSKGAYVCQADVIRQYIKRGRDSFYQDPLMQEFIAEFKTRFNHERK